MKQRYPIGIQDFAKLRQEDYLYVDKTKAIYELAQSGSYFFLSRPRRFGKSLLLSTLKYFFQGKKELFQGLWVEQADYPWHAHPVLHISFSSIDYKGLGLAAALENAIFEAAELYGVVLKSQSLASRFRELIQILGKGPQKLVILIDEYDKPLIDYIEDMPQAEANRDTLKNFFSVIKDSDPFIRFFFITGVSKFSKVSLFSDLNHLEDLTINPLSATLVGYTQAEVEHYFANEITALQTASGKSHEETLAEIRRWYNGYRWWGSETLYNPFSVLNLMKSGQFINYWWESGTPSFLIKLLRNQFRYNVEQVDAGSDIFDSYTLESIEWKSLMFQTGYLTIQGYDPDVRL
ncbi:MAG: AAA family ATPase, partial [Bacteroidetes bacterium]